MFNSQSLANIGLDPSSLHPDVRERPCALTVGPSDFIRDPPATPIPINILDLTKKRERQPNLLKDLGCEDVSGTEEEEELKDALSPKYDQLSIAKFWWICEVLPFIHIRQLEQGNWKRSFLYVFLIVYCFEKYWFLIRFPPPAPSPFIHLPISGRILVEVDSFQT